MAELTVSEIATLVGGDLLGDGAAPIRGVAPLESASPDRLSFVANGRYAGYLQDTRAGAILVAPDLLARVPERLTRIVVPDPHLALHRVLTALHPPRRWSAGVHPTALVDPSARLEDGVSVGPFVVIEAGARVGHGTRIGPHSVVGEGSRIGRDCVLHAHVTLYQGVVVGDRCTLHSGVRLGREGFGFVWLDGGHRKVPQVGGCVVGDDVELGSNVTVDRGSIGDTVIGAGTKVDSLVQIGHNVKVGRHAILAAQVGISGSAILEDGVVLGGQVGVGGHLTVGAGARVGGQGGVIGDLAGGTTYSGYPARPHREALRAQGLVLRLPELLKRLRALEKAILGSND